MSDFDEPNRKNAAPAKPNKSKAPAPKPKDWGPTRGTKIAVNRSPGADSYKVPLGAKHQQGYSVAANGQVTWAHRVNDRSFGTGSGSQSTLDVRATDAGELELQTTATIDGEPHQSPITTLMTSKGAVELLGLSAHSARGDSPVAQTMQLGEELVARVRLHDVDDKQIVSSFSGGLTVKQTSKIGPQTFDVTLAPSTTTEAALATNGEAHNASGHLIAAPTGVVTTALTPAHLDIRVERRMTNRDDFGSRPRNTRDAVERVTRAWNTLYESRRDGLLALSASLKEKDPVPEPPLLRSLLESVAGMALSAATAGIGQKLVEGITSQAFAETVKVMIESSLADVVTAGVSAGVAEAAQQSTTLRTPGGTLLSVETYFTFTQRNALARTGLDHVNRVTTSLYSLTERLDRDRSGDGYRAAVLAEQAILPHLKHAMDLQYSESLQAWATLMANLRLGDGDRKINRGKGTELGTLITPSKIGSFGDGIAPPGLDKVPGVLRLELGTPELNQKGLMVRRAQIDGFDSDKMVDGLHRTVRELLNLPIIASYVEPFPKHQAVDRPQRTFVVSRNEHGVYLADDRGDLLQAMFGLSDHKAAKHIFEHQIANQVISPSRG